MGSCISTTAKCCGKAAKGAIKEMLDIKDNKGLATIVNEVHHHHHYGNQPKTINETIAQHREQTVMAQEREHEDLPSARDEDLARLAANIRSFDEDEYPQEAEDVVPSNEESLLSSNQESVASVVDITEVNPEEEQDSQPREKIKIKVTKTSSGTQILEIDSDRPYTPGDIRSSVSVPEFMSQFDQLAIAGDSAPVITEVN